MCSDVRGLQAPKKQPLPAGQSTSLRHDWHCPPMHSKPAPQSLFPWQAVHAPFTHVWPGLHVAPHGTQTPELHDSPALQFALA